MKPSAIDRQYILKKTCISYSQYPKIIKLPIDKIWEKNNIFFLGINGTKTNSISENKTKTRYAELIRWYSNFVPTMYSNPDILKLAVQCRKNEINKIPPMMNLNHNFLSRMFNISLPLTFENEF